MLILFLFLLNLISGTKSVAKSKSFEPQLSLPVAFGEPETLQNVIKTLQKHGHKDPLKWTKNNPLSIHNATLDDQFALRKWCSDFYRRKIDSETLIFRLQQLLKNPTVDFSLDNFKIVKMAAQLGNSQITFKILSKIHVIDNQIMHEVLNRAAFSHNLSLVKKLILEYHVNPESDTLKCAVQSGDLQISKYLREYMRLEYPSFMIYNAAERSGNKELISYLNSNLEYSIVEPLKEPLEEPLEDEGKENLNNFKRKFLKFGSFFGRPRRNT